MRSTGSLRVSRCLMPSLRFTTRNQKRIELFQKQETGFPCVVCCEADPPPKLPCRSPMERSFPKFAFRSSNVAPASNCGDANVQRKGQHWCLVSRRRRKRKYILATWLAINTPAEFACFLSLLSFSKSLVCDSKTELLPRYGAENSKIRRHTASICLRTQSKRESQCVCLESAVALRKTKKATHPDSWLEK